MKSVWARSVSACALVGAVLVAPSQASATKITGKLDNWELLVNPVWQEGKDPKKHGYSFREPVPTVPAKFRAMFPHIPKELCVAALASTAQKPPKTPILIRVGGGRTSPVTIVVPPGTQLQFKNTDPFMHRLYAVGVNTFSPNDTIKGGTRDWTVPKEGSFEIRDELAPSLRFWVIANAKVAGISYPSLKGDFRLTVEEPGLYTVAAFFSGKQVGEKREVEVAGKDLDISKQALKVAKDKPKGKGKGED